MFSIEKTQKLGQKHLDVRHINITHNVLAICLERTKKI